MKAVLCSMALFCLLTVSLGAMPKVAVFDAILPTKIDKDIGVAITEKVSEELVSSGKFVVLDRTLINRSLKEIKFQMSSLTGDEEIQKAGEQLALKLGVSYIVTLQVSLISDTYLVSAKMIDVKTGEIVAQASDEQEGKASVTLKIAQNVGKKLASSEAIGSSENGILKIAVLAPLSGPVPTFGVSTRDGALLAINEWNAKGGVLGMRITPIVEDSQCTPDPAVNAANKVIKQDKVHYIVGEVCSKASIPISEIANAAKVIQISPTSTNTAVTVDKSGNTRPYTFRACFIDPFQGKLGAVFAVSRLGAKKAFVMYDQSNDYVRGLAEVFETTFRQLGGEIVGKESYAGARETDFSAILTKVDDSEPDIVYLPDYYNIVNLAAKQAKAMGITAPFMGGDGWDSTDLDTTAADGAYYTDHYSTENPRAEVQNFRKAYGVAYKDSQGAPIVPDALAALAYDATNLLLTAINNAGADDTDKVKAALEDISYNAVSGNITFDDQHNPIKGGVIIHVKGGQQVFDSFLSPADFSLKPKVTFFWPLYDGLTEEFRASVQAAFNKSSNDSQTEIVPVKWNDLQDKLTSAIAAGTPPDISVVGTRWLLDFVSANSVDEVTQYLSKSTMNNINPAALEARINGKLMGIPVAAGARLLAINTDITKSVPRTMEELEEDVKRITKSDKICGLIMPGKSHAELTDFCYYFYSAGGDYFETNADGSYGKCTVNSEAGVKALTFMQQLALKDKVVQDGFTNMDRLGSHPLFYAGKAGYVMIGAWVDSALRQAGAKFPVKYASIPPFAGHKPAGLIITDSIAFFSKAKNLKAAGKFIDFFYQDAYKGKFDQLVGFPPVTLSAARDPFWRTPLYQALAAAALTARPWPLVDNFDTLTDEVWKACENVFQGQASPKDALDAAAAAVDQARGM